MSMQTFEIGPAELQAFVGNWFPDRSPPSDGLIVQSWYRSVMQHGLRPAGRVESVVLSAADIHRHQDQHHEYMAIAGQGVSGLAERVGQAGFAVLLSDEHGITLDSRLPRNSPTFTDSGLVVGSRWDEAVVGTNGIGTGLASATPLIIHREEHFLRVNDRLSCSVAPIFDARGNLRGCLNASCLNISGPKATQYLTLQLVIMYARMIENACLRHNHRHTLTLMLKPCTGISDLANEQLLALDEAGCVIGANHAAFQHFQGHGQQPLLGRALDSLLPVDVEQLLRLCHGGAAATRLMCGTQMLEVGLRMPTPMPQPSRARPAQRSPVSHPPTLERLAGADATLRQQVDRLRKLLDKDLPILITGETGTGKEAFARAIHQASRRRDGPFVALNCAAIPETLIESELFGYRGGSFTGASKKGMKGKLELANGGTLFLDEIGDMPAHLQTRLLRVLAEREISPLGAAAPLPLDIQVVSATHQDLTQLIETRAFREDLFYRLSGMTLHLPAVRARSDIDGVIQGVLNGLPDGANCRLEPAALICLRNYPWPGNVRQLINALRYAVALAEGNVISLSCLPAEIFKQNAVQDERSVHAIAPARMTPQDEGQQLRDVLRRHRWNISAVATELTVARSTLYRRMKKYGITQPV